MWFEIGNRAYKLSRSVHHNCDDITVGACKLGLVDEAVSHHDTKQLETMQ